MYISDRYYRYGSSIAVCANIICIFAVMALILALKNPTVTTVFYWLGIGFSGVTAVLVLSIVGRRILRFIYLRCNNFAESRTTAMPHASLRATQMIAASLTPKTSGRFTYAIERLPDCRAEISMHVQAHWTEMASRSDIRTLSVDWEAYLAADRLGRVTLGTVRRDGRLIGYLGMVQRADFHSKGTVGAESAFYYVEHRPMRGLVERNLIRFVLEHLAQQGIKYIRFRNKVSHSNAPILKSLGFVPDEMSYVLKD